VPPSVMELVGHSGSQAPQEMHASLIFIAMSNSPDAKILLQLTG
jgi:hypothetical protein